MLRIIPVWFFFLLMSWQLFAQELPPVASFEPELYNGGSQNWGLSQDESDFIYVANNEGLLEYNGQRWSTYPSPNETLVRSVKAHNGRIYTGMYMDFGYWERTASGALAYQSLCDNERDKMLPDEHFWNIILHEGYLVFQSLDQLFLYQPEEGSIRVITPEWGVSKVFKTAKSLYFSDQKQGLFRLEGGTAVAVLEQESPAVFITHLWGKAGELVLQTATDGCYRLEDGALKKTSLHPFLEGKSVYSASNLRLGGRAFGTVSNGVYVVGPDGELAYHLDQVDGLSNNTVLSLFEDARSNLWVGTDNGISCINLSSPFRKFTDNSGQLGTVHASAVHGGNLYLGSNQGLFVKSVNGGDLPRLVPGTRGQVWSLFQHQGVLFCGHDRGTFTIDGLRAESLGAQNGGTWGFVPVPGRPDLLLQGNYFGLSVLTLTSGRWLFRNKVDGFDYSARFLAASAESEVYISHEYRGVYGLKLDEDFRKVTDLKLYNTPEKGKNAGLTSFQDGVVYFSRDGVFTLQDFDGGFQRSAPLSNSISKTEYTSGKMTAEAKRLWFFTAESISFFHRGALSDDLQRQTIPVPSRLIDAKSGYENITPIGGDTLLIGTADGYLQLALSAVPLHQHQLYLTSATALPAAGNPIPLALGEEGEIPFEDHSVTFELAVASFEKYFIPRYQYRLLGLSEEWSGWSTESTISFPGLPYGEYVLEARSLLGRRSAENSVSYSFEVLRPWYASNWALVLYLLVTGLLIYLLHRSYTRYYRRKQKALQEESDQRLAAREREAELELIRINNQHLQQEISSKSRETAISTMSLVRKNELLQQIKDKLLSDQDPERRIQEVIKTIDHNIDEAETWNLFKEAFENTDQDFFKKVKELHPGLSPNDLKLCAYLRLNLSSKEIAPMLNISPRSVEVKRYRLRKKMNLEAKTGLVDYIMGI
ncbi:LuxR C-terminal-related transcriptional regulator [Neolewinella agarilytica]|uniref:helix-turn-helix and ligand-binding sensor domain-containing protein n=1 Tax=Neolewinella agarilytica TaxID=478744 RepID=UPI0023562A24|nr:LuxR C-terminal-related transcriptional regulator [Neolewinella agarilytica]